MIFLGRNENEKGNYSNDIFLCMLGSIVTNTYALDLGNLDRLSLNEDVSVLSSYMETISPYFTNYVDTDANWVESNGHLSITINPINVNDTIYVQFKRWTGGIGGSNVSDKIAIDAKKGGYAAVTKLPAGKYFIRISHKNSNYIKITKAYVIWE